MAIVSEYKTGTRRNTELVLLLFAVGIAMGAYALVELGVSDERALTMKVVWYGGALALLSGTMHVLLRIFASYADPIILPVVTALNGIGLAMIHRIDYGYFDKRGENWAALAPKQLLVMTVGMIGAAAVLIVLRRHQKLRAYTYTAMIVAVLLLLLPLLPAPIGRAANGARIWINVGPMTFQPAELTKIVLTVFFAGYLVSNRDQLALAGPKILGLRLPRGRDLGPLLVVWLVSIGVLVFQKDLGTSLLLFGLFVAMIYIATERGSWVVISLLLFGSGAFLAWTQFGHVQSRVDGWLNAMDTAVYNKVGGSQQLVTGQFGMANGGLLGEGLGMGTPTVTVFSESDFIYAALGEELGLVGLTAMMLLFMILVERAFRTAIGVRDGFGKLLAAGLGFVMCLQVFVVVGGVTRLIPLTGLTFPFVAYGGSSLLANWLIVGLLLRISDSARRPTPPPAPSLITEDEGATTALSIQTASNTQGGAQ